MANKAGEINAFSLWGQLEKCGHNITIQQIEESLESLDMSPDGFRLYDFAFRLFLKNQSTSVIKSEPETDIRQDVYDWIVAGQKISDIIEAIYKRDPSLDAGAIIMGATDALISAGNPNAQKLFGWCLEASRLLFLQMRAIGDFAGALRAVKNMFDMSDKIGVFNDFNIQQGEILDETAKEENPRRAGDSTGDGLDADEEAGTETDE